MELTEPNLANLHVGIERMLSRRFGYCMRGGTTGQGTPAVRDNPDGPLLFTAMIRIANTRHVRIWWSLNLQSELMDLLLCAHCRTNTEDSTPAPGDLRFAPRNTWGTPAHEEWPHAIHGAPLHMTSGPTAMRSHTLVATSQSRPLPPQS